MAIQVGTYKGSVSKNSGWYEFWVTLIESEINETAIANNQTTVTAIAKLKRISYYTFDTVNSNQTQTISIDGNTDSTNIRVDITGTNQGGEIELWRRSVPITHNDDGSKTVNISIRCNTSTGTYAAGLCSFDADLILSTIPRASSVTATTANIGENTTIIINKKVSSFTHTINYTFGGLSGQIANRTYDTTIGWTIPNDFYSQIPNSKSGTGQIICITYNGDIEVGTSVTNLNVVVREDINLPIVSINVEDTNKLLQTGNTTVGLTGNSGVVIRGVSDVIVSASAQAQNYASISNIFVNCGDGQSSGNLTPTFYNVNNEYFAISAKDSRGISNSASKVLGIINYTNIKTTKTILSRISQTSGTIKLNLEGTYFNGSFGAVHNDIILQYRYKLSSSSTWGDYITLDLFKNGNNFSYNNENLVTDLDYQKSYNFQIVLIDKVQVYTLAINISKGVPIFDYGEDDFRVNYPMTAPTLNGYTPNIAMTKYIKNLNTRTHIDWQGQEDGEAHLISKACLAFWNGAHSGDTASNLEYCSEGLIQSKPISLYDNSSGSNGTIILAHDSSNFNYIEIIVKNNNNNYISTGKIYSPNGKRICITSNATPGDGAAYWKASTFLINGTTITIPEYAESHITGTSNACGTNGYNLNYIVKVIGYK